MEYYINLLDYRLTLCIGLFLFSIESVQNGRLHLPATNQIPDNRLEEHLAPSSRKNVTGGLVVRQFRTRKHPANVTNEIRRIDHHKEYQLPALHPKGNRSIQHHCNCLCHKDHDRLYELLSRLFGAKNQPPEITFDYALEHSDRWTLRMAKSRLAVLMQKLQEAKYKYRDVFENINKSAGMIAEDVERTFDQVSKKLDALDDLPVLPNDYRGHEEFIRQQQENWNEDDHRMHKEMYKQMIQMK